MTYFVGAEIAYAPAQLCMSTSYPPSVHMNLGRGIVACEKIRQYTSLYPDHKASLKIEDEFLFVLEPSPRTAESLSKTSMTNTNEFLDLSF
jgi:hypothetical protein